VTSEILFSARATTDGKSMAVSGNWLGSRMSQQSSKSENYGISIEEADYKQNRVNHAERSRIRFSYFLDSSVPSLSYSC
jgi:hypothetical protein